MQHYTKGCVDCIHRDDILEQGEFNQFLSQKLTDLKSHANQLLIPCERNIEIMRFFDEVIIYTDAVKKFTEEITSDLLENDLDTKLKKLRKYMSFKKLKEFDKEYESLEPAILVNYFIRNLSDLGINREKKIVSSNSYDFAWTGNLLGTYEPKVENLIYTFKYRLESLTPVNLMEIGIAGEIYTTEPVEYLRVFIVKGDTILPIKDCCLPSCMHDRISKQYILGEGFRVEPGEEIEIKLVPNRRHIYCIINPHQEINFGDKRLFLLVDPNHAYNMAMPIYFKFEDIKLK